MGKQANKSGSHFGGEWTRQKLHIIDQYLGAYSKVLKNLRVKKIYVDGFAGSGKTELKKTGNFGDINIVDGSALLSLKYKIANHLATR